MNISRKSALSLGMAMTTIGALTLVDAPAHADLVFNASTIVGSIYNYDLNFSDNIDVGTGLPAQRLVSGSFATLYDISGLNSATLNPAFASQFTLSQQNTGITPTGTAPTDNNGLPNVTLTYTGPTLTSDASFASILQVNSSFTTVNLNGQFTSQVTKNAGVDAGTPIASILGRIAVPGTTTPEPGNLALLVGAGLSGSVFAFRRRRNRK